MKETEATAPAIIRLPPAPGGPIDASAIEDAVRDWVTSPAFTALVADFDGPPAQSDLACYLEALDRFSAAWDFRGGKERDAALSVNMSEASERRILDAARVLGLRNSFEHPQAKRYDHCLILGGESVPASLDPRGQASWRGVGSNLAMSLLWEVSVCLPKMSWLWRERRG